MQVSIGNDHRGVNQKNSAAEAIRETENTVDDCGTNETESCDYPDIAKLVAEKVAEGSSELGILICGTGIGMSMAANKIPGIRAAVCHNVETAQLSRQHNDANILCLPGNSLDGDGIKKVVTAWLQTEFEGGRHQRRVEKIKDLECQKSTN